MFIFHQYIMWLSHQSEKFLACFNLYFFYTFGYRIRVRNSSRVLGSSRNTPNIVLVTVLLFSFCTPLITIHMCLKYIKTKIEVTDASFIHTTNSGIVDKCNSMYKSIMYYRGGVSRCLFSCSCVRGLYEPQIYHIEDYIHRLQVSVYFGLLITRVKL